MSVIRVIVSSLSLGTSISTAPAASVSTVSGCLPLRELRRLRSSIVGLSYPRCAAHFLVKRGLNHQLGHRLRQPAWSGWTAAVSSTGSALELHEGDELTASFSVITTLSAETRPADKATYTVSAIVPHSYVRHGKYFAGTIHESRRDIVGSRAAV